MSKSALGWIILLFAFNLCTLGLNGSLIFLLCSSSVFLGAIFILLCHGRNNLNVFLKNISEFQLDFPNYKLSHIESMIINPVKSSKQDRRMTGSIIIDEPLHEIIQFALRDYVQSWFHSISDDDQFICEMEKIAQGAVISFSNRSKEIDWVPYLTTQLVDDFASHLRLFRKAQQKVKKQQSRDSCFKPDLDSIFFNLELEMEESLCRDGICNNVDNEKAFVRDIIDIILFLLISSQNFENKPYRLLLREVIVNYLVIPTFETFADPDYINQTIVWMCKDVPVSSEVFLTVVKSTDNVDELVAVCESVTHEVAIQRAKDTGGDDDTEIKQRLSSLNYVKKVVEMKIQRLNEGLDETDSLGLSSQIDYNRWLVPGQKLPHLSLEFVLKNNIALSFFMDYMTSINCQAYLFFYLNVEGYKVSAEQQLSAHSLSGLNTASSNAQVDLESLRQAAVSIYQTCLSEEAVPSIIVLDNYHNDITHTITKKLLMRIRTDPSPSDCWFDEAQHKIYEMFLSINKFFPCFKKSVSYVKLLAELDLLKDTSKFDEDDHLEDNKSVENLEPGAELNEDNISLSSLDQEDAISLVDSLSSRGSCNEESSSINTEPVTSVPSHITFMADIISTAKETLKGKSYIVYVIRVVKTDDNEGIQDEWTVYRRYSDFHDFHMVLFSKFECVSKIRFPGKKAFNNMSNIFLKKRTMLLKEYLLTLQSPYILSTNKRLKDYLHQFLSKGCYEREKSVMARRVEDMVKPLKTVKDAVLNVPENLIDGMAEMTAGLSKVLSNTRPKSTINSEENSGKVGAALMYPENSIDNIPLRIMLLLMDEVFDLKSRNLWLRRRIITLLRQIIKATYGDMINRKIVDYVQFTLSAEQVSEYLRSFKDSFWPNGIKSPPYPERDKNTKMRTRVAAKTAMLCLFSDELKHIIGTETFRKGIICIFEMFQNKTLNKRMLYVFLEGVIETLFPSNNFRKTFDYLHCHIQKSRSANPQKKTFH